MSKVTCDRPTSRSPASPTVNQYLAAGRIDVTHLRYRVAR
jgi:hypothetical protein